jgi:ClpP class serine protease
MMATDDSPGAFEFENHDGVAHLKLHGPFDLDGLTWETFLSRMGELGSISRIDLELNSVGGTFIDCWKIHQALTRGPFSLLPKRVSITGECSSCAVMVAMAANRITMEQSAIMRFHRVRSSSGNQTCADERTGAFAHVVAERIGADTVTGVIFWMTNEVTFSAQEALKHRLVDEII